MGLPATAAAGLPHVAVDDCAFAQAKEMGEAALDGFKMMNEFFGHLSVNFFGAAAAIVGLQAEVGTMFASAIKAGAMPALVNGNIAALAQVCTTYKNDWLLRSGNIRPLQDGACPNSHTARMGRRPYGYW